MNVNCQLVTFPVNDGDVFSALTWHYKKTTCIKFAIYC